MLLTHPLIPKCFACCLSDRFPCEGTNLFSLYKLHGRVIWRTEGAIRAHVWSGASTAAFISQYYYVFLQTLSSAYISADMPSPSLYWLLSGNCSCCLFWQSRSIGALRRIPNSIWHHCLVALMQFSYLLYMHSAGQLDFFSLLGIHFMLNKCLEALTGNPIKRLDRNPATFLHAYTCLPLAQSTRQAASAVLQDIADSGVLFALLMCEHKVCPTSCQNLHCDSYYIRLVSRVLSVKVHFALSNPDCQYVM